MTKVYRYDVLCLESDLAKRLPIMAGGRHAESGRQIGFLIKGKYVIMISLKDLDAIVRRNEQAIKLLNERVKLQNEQIQILREMLKTQGKQIERIHRD